MWLIPTSLADADEKGTDSAEHAVLGGSEEAVGGTELLPSLPTMKVLASEAVSSVKVPRNVQVTH